MQPPLRRQEWPAPETAVEDDDSLHGFDQIRKTQQIEPVETTLVAKIKEETAND